MPTATADRLRHAIAAHAAAIAKTSRPKDEPPDARAFSPRDADGAGALHVAPPPIDRILGGEWLDTEHGPVFVRDTWHALDHEHGASVLGDILDVSPDAIGMLSASRADHVDPAPAVDPAACAFFDIETTGLSGGTGTYIVLAGLGTFEQPVPDEPLAFRLRQYFLAGLEHERAMLALLAADLAHRDAVVTYNGRAFDLPIVESRLTMSRLKSPCRALAHVDLLHHVRSLYAHRFPGCKLAEAERRLLRLERFDDLPGFMIPPLYRDYLVAGRTAPGRAARLRPVFRHNADDVISLVGVLSRLATMLTHDDHDPDDGVALARWWERRGDEQRAMRLYRAALPWLDGDGAWPWAAARHARLCRRAGRRDEAAALWRALFERGDAAAGLALAKHLEHHERALGPAREAVESLLQLAAEDGKPALIHRLRRIESKADRARRRAAA
jgi:uncharacterized protein YprB with RNaseH-like and TPR domain